LESEPQPMMQSEKAMGFVSSDYLPQASVPG